MQGNDQGWIPDNSGVMRQTERQVWYGQAQEEVDRLIKDDPGGDTFSYRYLAKFKPEEYDSNNRLNAKNQGSVGSCVGVATARLIDHLQAIDIYLRQDSETFCDLVSPEWCYATSREAAGMLGRSDGSTNSGQLKALQQDGVLFQRKYGVYDLRKYSPNLCRVWGRWGVPDELRVEGAKHVLLKSFRVRSVDQWWSLAGAGYPINLCSGWGGTGYRDSEGYMRKSGRWMHAMGNPAARRLHPKKGRSFLICNSWGNQWAKKGSIWPEDMPHGSFWISESDASWIVRNGEVIAYADFKGGFTAPYDWGKAINWSEDDIEVIWDDEDTDVF
tara:strand:- start:1767 stop:2753 length:987 start_codon:yes stop_codon:yes gene_type:complete